MAPGEAIAHEHRAVSESRTAPPIPPIWVIVEAMEDAPLLLCNSARAAAMPAKQQAEASWRKSLVWIARVLPRKKVREASSGPNGFGILAPGARTGMTMRLATRKAAYRKAREMAMRPIVREADGIAFSIRVKRKSFRGMGLG